MQRAVAASPGEIFAVLSDPRGHVAIDSSGMLMAADGEPVTKAGDTFVVHMDREALNDFPLGLYDVTVEIVTFEHGPGDRVDHRRPVATSATCTVTGLSRSTRARW